MMIDKMIKSRWVKALKEAPLPKNIEGMRDVKTGAMDVLGILCDVLKDEIGGSWENESFIYRRKQFIYYPPVTVSLMLGLRAVRIESVTISYNGGKVPLFRLNDDTNLTLSQIADLIEDQL